MYYYIKKYLEIHILGLCWTVYLPMSVCSPGYVAVVWSEIFWGLWGQHLLSLCCWKYAVFAKAHLITIHIQFWFNQVCSFLQKEVVLLPKKNTSLVNNYLIMIHVQFELNPVCSFEEQGLLVYSYFLVYYFKTMSCGGGILVDQSTPY